MGEFISARCTCGYECRELTIGCGMSDKCYVLVWCPNCSRHRSVGENRVSAGCPRCHSRLTVVKLNHIEGIGDDFEGPYPCPRCGERKLSFELEALWD
jgi:hypothetical protein